MQVQYVLLFQNRAVTEFDSHHTEAKSAGWRSGKRHCYRCGQGRIQGGMWKCIPPQAIFKHVFDEYNFSIISNLFDNNNSYALSTHNRKCTNKCIIFGETLGFKGKKFEQNLPKNSSISTKMATTAKIYRGSISPDRSMVPF